MLKKWDTTKKRVARSVLSIKHLIFLVTQLFRSLGESGDDPDEGSGEDEVVHCEAVAVAILQRPQTLQQTSCPLTVKDRKKGSKINLKCIKFSN